MADSRLHKLSEAGVSVWVDNLSRETIQDGTLARLMEEDAGVGVTSNPTIFQKAMASGSAYDEQLKQCAAEGIDEKETFIRLSEKDVSDACDLMRGVWDDTGGRDGYVSIEVDPTLAYDTEATYKEAIRLHEWIDRPNLYVKIPGTEPGLKAIEDCIAVGRSINVTLLFSLQRHKEAMEAYVRGLERFVDDGGDATKVRSVASFFVSRVDTETDKRLEAIGTEEALALRGRLAIANARIAYRHYKQVFSGERWEALEQKGALPQRCLWASMSTKNPEYRDVLYVEELIGPHTVNTMPEETIQAFQDHGEVRGDTVDDDLEAARALPKEELPAVGVDYDDVVETLEKEGVQKFSDSFAELLDGVKAKREAVAA